MIEKKSPHQHLTTAPQRNHSLWSFHFRRTLRSIWQPLLQPHTYGMWRRGERLIMAGNSQWLINGSTWYLLGQQRDNNMELQIWAMQKWRVLSGVAGTKLTILVVFSFHFPKLPCLNSPPEHTGQTFSAWVDGLKCRRQAAASGGVVKSNPVIMAWGGVRSTVRFVRRWLNVYPQVWFRDVTWWICLQ